MADIARIEDRIDRVAAGSLQVSDQLGGLRFQNMIEVMEFAKMMSVSGLAVPAHLRGEPGTCLAVCVQALEWRFSPFSVANKSYSVNGRIAFESQLIHAVIEARAPIERRLRCEYEGEGDTRVCIVTGQIKGELDPLIYRSPPISKITPKNSPLWKTDPDQQLWYFSSRSWARRYCPDTLLGVFARDELEDSHVGPDNAKDVSKPDVASRLKAKGARGFNASHVERETRGGVVDNTEAQREAGTKPSPPASTADEALASAQESSADDSGAAQDRCESAAPTNSLETESPRSESQADMPAAAPDVPSSVAASTPPSASAVDDEEQASDASPAGLPSGWPLLYSAALRRAQKKESLEKYAAQFWQDRGGWAAHKNTEDGATAVAIFDVFQQNFGNREQIEAALREII